MHYKNSLPKIITAVGLLIHISCKDNPAPCSCTIPEYYDEATGIIKDNQQQQQNISLDPKIKSDINQQIKVELSAGLKMDNIYENVNETYWKVKNTNPQINNNFRLYRAIACAYFEVICQDNSLSDAEKTAQKNTIIRLFEANLKNAQQSHSAPNAPTAVPHEQMRQSSRSDPSSLSPSSMPSKTPQTNYYNPDIKADVAVIVASNDPDRNTGFNISQIFKKKKLQTTNTLFNSTFRNEQLSKIQAGNLSFFEHYDLRNNVKCICVIDPQIEIKPASFQGELYLEAEGNYQVDIVQLESMQTNSFSINCKGVGTTNTAALENLGEKLTVKFSEKFNDFSSCKF